MRRDRGRRLLYLHPQLHATRRRYQHSNPYGPGHRWKQRCGGRLWNRRRTVATPSFSLSAGTYTGAQPLTITDATLGASIYYTTDGSTPGPNAGTSTLYSGAISIGNSETVNAIAVDPGDTSSLVATAAYVINVVGASATPTFSVAPGTYTTPQSVSIVDTTAGVTIYYTTNGSAPTSSSAVTALRSTSRPR